MTVPLGATAGDFLDKPLDHGGLDLSRHAASAVLAAVILACIALLPQRPERRPSQLESTMSANPKDEFFSKTVDSTVDFSFTSEVAQVFDDMVSRSVPYYPEMQRMIAELAADHAQAGTAVYDLGCSTGTTLQLMGRTIEPSVTFVGVDDSHDMLAKCDDKLKQDGFDRPYALQYADMNEGLAVDNASVVVFCLTLQFIRPMHRDRLLRTICQGMVPGGVLLLVEKILTENSTFNRDFIKYYYEYKRRQNYSEMEISQKREALENVLIPYRLSENVSMLKEAGFGHCEVFFKWYNFCGVIAKKT